MNKDNVGLNVHTTTDPRQIGLGRDLHIGWARIDVNWDGIEVSKNHFRWTELDSAVQQWMVAGVNIYATIAYSPGWANGNQPRTAPPLNASDYANFVTQVVQRYQGKIAYWGVWNEPNLTAFYTGSLEEYLAKILIPAADAIHAADSTAKVAGPELSHAGNFRDSYFWYHWMTTILNRAGQRLDVITHHIYKEPTSLELWRRLDGFVFPYWEGKNLQATLRDCGAGDKPLWLTEIGWKSNTGGTPAQADNYAKFFDGMQTRGWISKVFFYELIDAEGFPDQWGLVTADYQKKPAYHVVQDRRQTMEQDASRSVWPTPRAA